MNKGCELCGGSCCKGMVFDAHKVFKHPDIVWWFQLHGEQTNYGTYLKCQCKKLVDGRCAIYEDRPKTCQVFMPGSVMCYEAIKRDCPEKLEQIRRALNE